MKRISLRRSLVGRGFRLGKSQQLQEHVLVAVRGVESLQETGVVLVAFLSQKLKKRKTEYWSKVLSNVTH